MMRDTCKKCGKKITSYDEESGKIIDCLCGKCWKKWRTFHSKYGHEINKKYSSGRNGHHSSWSVYLGELPNLWTSDRERVEFT